MKAVSRERDSRDEEKPSKFLEVQIDVPKVEEPSTGL
jgi:hypothetical protein